MDKSSLDGLARFCASQQEKFDQCAWLSQGAADPTAYAVAAKYLSMTSWYGYEEPLESVATQLWPALAVRNASDRELRSIGLDLGSLSASIRFRIALRSIERMSKTADALGSPAREATDAAESLPT